MLLLTPQHFSDYELLDCGNFLKLERFGQYITIRPEPQAVWRPEWSMPEWKKKAHIEFVPKTSSSGNWNKIKSSPEKWNIAYQFKDGRKFQLKLSLTSFKHLGVFPEQAVNWDYIYQSIHQLKKKVDEPKVLNLFAYTGAASLAAKSAGADITHLDSVKQVVTWAKENMELSNLNNIRWIVEDALQFVKREVKRGKKYNGIILDPPAYGHGTDGQKWKLEDMISEMMQYVMQLLDEKNSFLILNCYSLGFSSIILENLIQHQKQLETGELFLQSKTNLKLPLGVFGRFIRMS